MAGHANGAAYRTVITTTADHPSWGDAWVVRRTARCGNVDDTGKTTGATGATGKSSVAGLGCSGSRALDDQAGRAYR